MTIELRGQIEKERQKVKNLTARLLMRLDGDLGVSRYLELSSEDWTEPAEGVRQNLCNLNADQDRVSVSNMSMGSETRIPEHVHDNHETIFVVDGEVTETVSNTRLRAGDVMMLPHGQRHGMTSKSGALLTLVWRPSVHHNISE